MIWVLLGLCLGGRSMSDYVVRYGVMRFLGVFAAAAGGEYSRGMKVIARTDRGVFSVDTKRELDRLLNVEVIPGECKAIRVDSAEQIILDIRYNCMHEDRIYDLVVVTTGFDHTHFVQTRLAIKQNETDATSNKSSEKTVQGTYTYSPSFKWRSTIHPY